MHLIEPCCAPKHLLALRGKLGEEGTAFFHGYGDLSLSELLPPLLTRYSETELMLVARAIPDHAARAILRSMGKQLVRADGKGTVDVLRKMILISDLREKASPLASTWRRQNPYPGRLELHDIQQGDTAIILPDIAFSAI